MPQPTSHAIRPVSQPLPRNVVALGLVSLFLGVSSQMTHSLLPVFLVTVLGTSVASVGIIEGIAEATNSLAKVLSGALSDWLGRRKPIVVLGYGLAALSKPLFPLAGDAATVLVARFIDRTGKGIRDAPRDALLADQLPSNARGSGFGLRLTLFTIGSVVGPLAATSVMVGSGGDFRLVFWLAVIPAFLSVAVLILAVKEPANARDIAKQRFSLRDLGRLPALFWWIVAITAMLELARFSQAFLLLKAKEVGVEAALIPIFLMLMGAVYGLTAYPCGILADRVNRRLQLGIGAVILLTGHLVLATADTIWMAAIGASLWGFQMGVTQGLVAAIVADAAPERLRGTAFGIYYLVDGVVSLLASSGAGVLWMTGGSGLTFSVGAALAAAVLLMLVIKPLPRATL
ncbi:MAG: MFS transporter [Burkholderiales bacterium]